MAAKSRLAPMKSLAIPRLELLGNLFLTRLIVSVENALSKVLQISEKYLWTDFQVTITWISPQRKGFKTFVENRVQEICKISNLNDWQYCKTEHNPADILTRLKTLEKFRENRFRWEGPGFLQEKSIPHFREYSSNQKQDIFNELRQIFWICRSRGFVRKVLKHCTLCRRFEGQSFQYTVAPPLIK